MVFDSPVLAPFAEQLAPVRAFFEAGPVYLIAILVGLLCLPLAMLMTRSGKKQVRLRSGLLGGRADQGAPGRVARAAHARRLETKQTKHARVCLRPCLLDGVMASQLASLRALSPNPALLPH